MSSEILIVANVSRGNSGGGWEHVRGIASGLKSIGHRTALLCVGDGAESADDDFVRILERRPPRRTLVWRAGSLANLSYWQREIASASQGCQAVVVLSPSMAAAARASAPMIYSPAIIAAFEQGLFSFERWLEWRAFQRADKVLLTTPAVRDAVERCYGCLDERVAICPLGVRWEKLEQTKDPRAEYGIPASARVILTVGAICPNKGQHLIAEALKTDCPQDWWWVVVGQGPDQDVLMATVRGTEFEARTRYIGQSQSVGDWYATADVMVAASRHETFGLAIAEALATGTPVVIPRNEPGGVLSPLAADVQEYGLGATFARNSANDLHDAIDTVIRSEVIDSRQTAAWARRQFNWQRYAQAINDLVAQCQLPSKQKTATAG